MCNQGPSYLCLIDTNHKFVRWWFIIVGCIDRYNRLPVVAECTNNNKAETVLNCFLKGVKKFGLPSMVRSDKGFGNVLVADYTVEKMGTYRGSMITGKITHNKRIERLWRNVSRFLSLFYPMFYLISRKILESLYSGMLISLLHIQK